jgi:hypothetical protein
MSSGPCCRARAARARPRRPCRPRARAGDRLGGVGSRRLQAAGASITRAYFGTDTHAFGLLLGSPSRSRSPASSSRGCTRRPGALVRPEGALVRPEVHSLRRNAASPRRSPPSGVVALTALVILSAWPRRVDYPMVPLAASLPRPSSSPRPFTRHRRSERRWTSRRCAGSASGHTESTCGMARRRPPRAGGRRTIHRMPRCHSRSASQQPSSRLSRRRCPIVCSSSPCDASVPRRSARARHASAARPHSGSVPHDARRRRPRGGRHDGRCRLAGRLLERGRRRRGARALAEPAAPRRTATTPRRASEPSALGAAPRPPRRPLSCLGCDAARADTASRYLPRRPARSERRPHRGWRRLGDARLRRGLLERSRIQVDAAVSRSMWAAARHHRRAVRAGRAARLRRRARDERSRRPPTCRRSTTPSARTARSCS